jgi:hypothetical protein
LFLLLDLHLSILLLLLTLGVSSHQKLKQLMYFLHPPKYLLAVFKLETEVQDAPSYSSVAPVLGGVSPPKAKAAV